jgi:hypothetical protein
MKSSPDIKKVRAVIITTVLIAATNFAISHAESVTSQIRFDGKSADVQLHRNISIASGEGSYPWPGPRPSNSYATDPGNLPPGPRPSSSFATDEGNLPPGPRPSSSFATDAGNLPPGPRPIM